MKKEQCKRLIFSIIVTFIILFIIIVTHYALRPAYNKYYKSFDTISFYSPIDKSKYVQTNVYQNYIKGKIEYLYNKLQLKIAEQNTRQQIIWQMRTIYFGILAGLATLLFNIKKRKKYSSILLTIGFILINYFLDIHLDDLYKRSDIYRSHLDGAIIELTNHTSNQYKIVTEDFDSQLRKGYEKSSFWRKVFVATNFKSSGERIVYYLIPLATICLYLIIYFYSRGRTRITC